MPDTTLSTRDILLNLQTAIIRVEDKIGRVEEKQDEQLEANSLLAQELAEVRAKADSNERMTRAAFAVIGALVFGIISLAFFVIQNSFRIGLGPIGG